MINIININCSLNVRYTFICNLSLFQPNVLMFSFSICCCCCCCLIFIVHAIFGNVSFSRPSSARKQILKKKKKKKVREKSRECHNHKPQPFPDPKRKKKPTNLNKHKPNKRTKSTKIISLFPKRGNRLRTVGRANHRGFKAL